MHAQRTFRRRLRFSVAPATLVSLILVLLAACAGQPPPALVTGNTIGVENPMARPSMAGQNSAVYFTVVNPGPDDDRLLAVSGDIADAVELHETVDDNGVMHMTPHPEGFAVPAGSTVTLAPGGKHVMMVGLHQDLTTGQTIVLTLTFEKASEMQVKAPVMDMAGSGMAGMNMASGGSMPADALSPQVSDDGLFRVTAASQMDPVTINKTHAWLLHVERSDGSPVEDAAISVEGRMPAHKHGLPTEPQVTENRGNGDYLLEGMRFSMAGAWEIDLTIDAGGQTDVVHFAFELK